MCGCGFTPPCPSLHRSSRRVLCHGTSWLVLNSITSLAISGNVYVSWTRPYGNDSTRIYDYWFNLKIWNVWRFNNIFWNMWRFTGILAMAIQCLFMNSMAIHGNRIFVAWRFKSSVVRIAIFQTEIFTRQLRSLECMYRYDEHILGREKAWNLIWYPWNL